MTSFFLLWKLTYPQSFMLIYGFFFELWVLNLKEKKEKKMKNSAHHSPITKHSSALYKVNEKSCRLRMGAYRDRVKRKGDKIVMGL